MRRNSIISIEIDEVTPCLRRLSDGAILQTKSYKLNRLPEHVDFSQWGFDWPELFSDGYAIYTIKAEGDYRMQGLIALQDEPQNSLIRLQNVESAPFNNRHNRKVEGQEYAGVGAHLFALSCLISFQKGYGGYVSMMAKTQLEKYYQDKLGAKRIGSSSLMYIDEVAARKLLVMYYGKDLHGRH